jgi:hypothetical protein
MGSPAVLHPTAELLEGTAALSVAHLYCSATEVLRRAQLPVVCGTQFQA